MAIGMLINITYALEASEEVVFNSVNVIATQFGLRGSFDVLAITSRASCARKKHIQNIGYLIVET
jgi:hypothetical protein